MFFLPGTKKKLLSVPQSPVAIRLGRNLTQKSPLDAAFGSTDSAGFSFLGRISVRDNFFCGRSWAEKSEGGEMEIRKRVQEEEWGTVSLAVF